MLSKHTLEELDKYILNSNIVLSEVHSNICFSESCEQSDLESFIEDNRSISFNELLFSYIDKLSLSDAEVYKKAGIDRRLFSKIRSNNDYKPSKRTIVALALALNLNEDDTNKLLHYAGYTLSNYDDFDLVIQFCIKMNIYSLYDVNQALDHRSLKPL